MNKRFYLNKDKKKDIVKMMFFLQKKDKNIPFKV